MFKLKRIVGALIVLCLLCGTSIAETLSLALAGSIAAGDIITLRAPYAGTVGEVPVGVGDQVALGSTIARMEKVTLYSPCDGIVGEVGAIAGDEAGYVSGKYGALMYIEPSQRFTLSASTKNAYDAEENKIVHVGEVVYFRNVNDTSKLGEGVVTKVSGSNYTVDVYDNNLSSGNSVYIYRDSAYASNSRIGTGSVSSLPNVAITGDGTIFRIIAKQGTKVSRGDPLIEMVQDTGLNINAMTDQVKADRESIVLSVDVHEGDSVKRGQTIATLAPLDNIIITVEVSDADIAFVNVGDKVGYRYAAMPITDRLYGQVESISNVASSGTFTVKVMITYATWMKLGMGVDVFINES